MKITRFEFQLENPQIAYCPGQVISGNVYLELAEELELRAITLELRGEAFVKWTENEGDHRREYNNYEYNNYGYDNYWYDNYERYINVISYLFGDMQRTDRQLNRGGHTYPFSFKLPKNLPYSYKGINGKVVYFLKCKINLPDWWKVDRNIRLDLNVFTLYDPNEFHLAGMTLRNEGIKMLGCLCCKSGPLKATLSIPKPGYMCGEMIIFTADIENFSKKRIEKIYVMLVQTETVRVNNGWTASRDKNILAVQGASIAPGQTFTWSNTGLLIPPVPPSQLINCNIISLSYSVVLSVHPSSMLDSRLEVPIIVNIGNVPLNHNADGMRNEHAYPNAMPQPGPYPNATPQPGPYPNATTQPGPYPNATPQPGPYPNATPQPGPYPNATPQPGPYPNATPQPGPYPNATPQPGPYPNATPQPGPYPNATPQPGPYPNASPQPEPYQNDIHRVANGTLPESDAATGTPDTTRSKHGDCL